MKTHMSSEQIARIAMTAAEAHYGATATKRSPRFAEYWLHNPQDRALWFEISKSILIAGAAFVEADRLRNEPVPLPGLGGRPIGAPSTAVRTSEPPEACQRPDTGPRGSIVGTSSPGGPGPGYRGAVAGFIEGLDMTDEDRAEFAAEVAKHDGSGNMPASRLDAVRRVLSQYDTPGKLCVRVGLDLFQSDHTVYWAHPIYFGIICGQGRIATIIDGPSNESGEIDAVCMCKDGTAFRISPLIPTGSFYRVHCEHVMHDEYTMGFVKYAPPIEAPAKGSA